MNPRIANAYFARLTRLSSINAAKSFKYLLMNILCG